MDRLLPLYLFESGNDSIGEGEASVGKCVSDGKELEVDEYGGIEVCGINGIVEGRNVNSLYVESLLHVHVT